MRWRKTFFLKLTGIDGESQDALHPNEIDVLTWDWSVSQQSTMHSGAGGGAGKYYNMAMLREEVQLSFDCVMQEYVIQSSQGGRGGTVSMGYDIQANEAI
nr:type VI secretion system tube protein Hcp [Burkholderia ubonensis]